MTIRMRVVCVIGLAAAAGCATPQGETMKEQRESMLAMRMETLNELERLKPGTKARLQKAPGYGVFSNRALKLMVAGSGNGYGIVRDNKTGKDTFMRMAEVNVGLGYGYKNYRTVFAFNTPEVLRRFVEEGWEFGGDADAAAKVPDAGGGVGASASANPIDIYQLTDTGLALQASVGGTKYWQDKDLTYAPDDMTPTNVRMKQGMKSISAGGQAK